MNSLRVFILFVSACFASVACGADSIAPLEQQLVGVWIERHPSANLVQFFPDHTFEVRLTKEKGQPKGLRSYRGSWALSEDCVLKVGVASGEKSMTMESILSFEGDDLVLTEKNEAPLKHSRVSGSIPAAYAW